MARPSEEKRRSRRSYEIVGSAFFVGYMSHTTLVAKIDPDKRQVFGWAKIAVRKDGTQSPDWQGDIVDTEELEQAVYKFALDYRDAGADHTRNYYTGKMIESFMITKSKLAAMGLAADALPEGWWVGFQIDDDAAWDKIKKGDYAMFSIEGRAVRERV